MDSLLLTGQEARPTVVFGMLLAGWKACCYGCLRSAVYHPLFTIPLRGCAAKLWI